MKSANEIFEELDPFEVTDWYHADVTKKFLEFLNALREDIKEHWVVGSLNKEDVYNEVRQNAFLIGQANLITYIQECLEDKMNEVRPNNDSSNRVSDSY